MIKIVAIIQARMGSTRLPGKVLKPILGQPMLAWVIKRVMQSKLLDAVCVATTIHPRDDVIVTFCEQHQIKSYRGSEYDVLDRYHRAAKAVGADAILRITADDPMVDPKIIDHLLAAYLSITPQVDYVSNNKPRSYPLGLDIEVFSAEKLAEIWQFDQSDWREHVTPYFYHHPEKYSIHSITNPVDYSHHRWTVDTPEDFELIERIYNHFGHGDFHWRDVLALLDKHPDWVQINQHIEQKKV